MYLIVGLGNPGSKYQMNRHNIGFMVCDAWLKALGGHDYREEHLALTVKFKIEGKDVLLAKPQTYMNKSGDSVLRLMQFYKIPKENLLVIHDDIDQPFSSMKFHYNRGHGGQNGVKHISQVLGGNEYARLKIGVGRPAHPDFDIGDYVLGNFPPEDLKMMPQLLDQSCDAIESFLFEGLSKASSLFNGPLK